MSASEELRALANEIDHDLASGTVIARKLRILALARPSGTEGLREAAQAVNNRLWNCLEGGCECEDPNACQCGYNEGMHEWSALQNALAAALAAALARAVDAS